MSGWLRGALGLLYPSGLRCLACRAEISEGEGLVGGLCPHCAEGMQVLPCGEPCPACGQPDGSRGCRACLPEPRRALQQIQAAYSHDGAARMLVHALKYRGLRQAGHLLAAGMAQVCADMQGEWDVLAPVPLHRRRQRQRGYNQAEVLARETGVVCGLPVACLLLRSRATMEQARLTREARSQNLQGAFAVRGQVRGLRILLVDDVCTTGATGEAAAIALREAGAQAVSLLTATIAVYRGG